MNELSIWWRFVLYGAFGITFEIFFTGIKHLLRSKGKDWTLLGKSYIWMLPIYGLAAFLFEPAHDFLRPYFWVLRGLIYTLGLFVVEYLTGGLLKLLTGKCPWDYTGKKFSVHGFIRLDYAPIWFFFCLTLELLHDLFLRVRY